MAVVDTADLISISEATKRGVSALVREAEAGHEQVLLRNNKPVAAVVGIERLEELQQLEEDLIDLTMIAARLLTDGPERHSLDDVLARFGYTREQIRALPD
jgi:prevent-host-death family protein